MNSDLLELIRLALTFLVNNAPEVSEDIELLIQSIFGGRDLTPEEVAQIRAALDENHGDLQNEVMERLAEESED